MTADDNRRILTYLREHCDAMVADLIELIDLESPTLHKPSVDALGTVLADELRGLGAAIEIVPSRRSVMLCAPAGMPVRAAWRSSATWIRFGRSAPLPGGLRASMATGFTALARWT